MHYNPIGPHVTYHWSSGFFGGGVRELLPDTGIIAIYVNYRTIYDGCLSLEAGLKPVIFVFGPLLGISRSYTFCPAIDLTPR